MKKAVKKSIKKRRLEVATKFSKEQWEKLCKKYKVKPTSKNIKFLGRGISVRTHSFGDKLVIKLTSCKDTVEAAYGLVGKKISCVAKVFEVGLTTKDELYYIVQEYVPEIKGKISRSIENIASYKFKQMVSMMVGPFTDIRVLTECFKMLAELKRAGINLNKVSDLHAGNVYETKSGPKIIDIGSLNF